MTLEIKTDEELEGDESIEETMARVIEELEEKEEEDGLQGEEEKREEGEREEVGEEEEKEEEVAAKPDEKEEKVEEKVEEDVEEKDDDISIPAEIEAPASWSDDAKEEFMELPPKQQESVVNAFKGMQADYTRKMQGIGGIVNALEPIQRECIENGIKYEDAIRRMVGAHLQISKDPAEGIRGVMQLYGVTPDQVLGIKPDDGGTSSADQDRISKLEAQVSQGQQAIQQNQNQVIESEVLEFAQKNEFFEEVESEMSMLVNSFISTGQPIPPLKDLYDRACWSNPTVREKLIARQTGEAANDKVEERKERVARSKRAAKVGKKRSAPRQAETGDKSLRQLLGEQYDASVANAAKR